MDKQQRLEHEAASFGRLRDYSREYTEVQNIESTNPTDFCRDGLSRWHPEEAVSPRAEIDDDAARARLCGIPHARSEANHKTQATTEQKVENVAGHQHR